MVRSSFKSSNRFRFYCFVGLIAGILIPGILLEAATPPDNGSSTQTQTPIHVTSDKLIMNNQTREAEFIGNVKAIQDTTTIYANSLKIRYRNSTSQPNALPNNEQAIEKIFANGKVTIHFGKRTAKSDQAVYNADNGILVLTGTNCTLTSENNTVSGEKITFHRYDGRIFVESGKQTQRVEAIISTQGKGLQ